MKDYLKRRILQFARFSSLGVFLHNCLKLPRSRPTEYFLGNGELLSMWTMRVVAPGLKNKQNEIIFMFLFCFYNWSDITYDTNQKMGTSATEILGRTQLAGLFILLFFPLDTTHLDGLIFEVREEFRWHIAGSTSFCVHKSSYFEGYQMLFYYIHTEKYSPKSIRKWVLANQRSELWFSHVKKMIRPIRIANDIFSRVRKNDTSHQKPQRCVSFAPKFPPFIAACWAPLRTHSWKKVFLRVFSR